MKKAQSLIEYGLILALVAVVAVTVLGKFSKSISKVGDQANTAVSESGTNAMCNYCNSLGDGAATCIQQNNLNCPDADADADAGGDGN